MEPTIHGDQVGALFPTTLTHRKPPWRSQQRRFIFNLFLAQYQPYFFNSSGIFTSLSWNSRSAHSLAFPPCIRASKFLQIIDITGTMAPFLLPFVFLLGTVSFISASVDFGAQRLPKGGALFSLTSRHLLTPRDGLADCGGDPDCTPQSWGCQCGFADDSWIAASDPSVPGSGPPAISSSSPPPPPSSTPPPAPSPTTSGEPVVTCSPAPTGDGCDCNDGSHSTQDEDGRCCIWDTDGTYFLAAIPL